MEKALNVDIRQFYREDLGVHSEELLDKLEAVSQAVTLQKGEILNKKGERQMVAPDKKTLKKSVKSMFFMVQTRCEVETIKY